eukprot:m.2350 g.2350  ORF g.2350 m.2350 type:complete len:574 (+) comp8589_c0_seq2:43-1764(+)
MSFFSNPFSSQVGQRIERATSDQLESEDWALNMEICDLINETDEGPKDAVKALKKRIVHNKNYRQVMLALSLLEACVKNCGKRFHLLVAHKDFIGELGKMGANKASTPMIVKQKVLILIQNWSDSFRNNPELSNIPMTHEYLRRQGVEFPPQDLDTLAPIYTPERSVPEEPVQPSPRPDHTPRYQPQPQPQPHPQSQPQPVQLRAQPAPQNEYTGTASITPTADQIGKIRSEVDVVLGNLRVLSDMLSALTPGQEDPSDWELLRDLNVTCRNMQSRIVDLLSRIVSEELTGELLHCNDELNNVFTRYDRFEKNHSAVASTFVEEQPNQLLETPSSSLYPSASIPSAPESSAPSEGSGLTTGALIDLASDEPHPVISDAPPSYSDIHSGLQHDLAGLDLGSGSAPPPLAAAPSTTNPFAESVSSGMAQQPATGQSDDFDMFAQSRQSFDQAAQNRSSKAQGYTVEEAHESVAGAINARSPFAPPAASGESSRLESMEEWLAATDLQPQQKPDAALSIQTSMTTSEFDKFLEDRAMKAVDSSGSGAPLNQSAQARRVRPQMQKEETGPEEELFAL